MRRLVEPSVDLHAAWLEAHDEWGPGLHEDGFGLVETDEVRSTAGFSAWVQKVSDKTRPIIFGQHAGVSSLLRWIVDDDRVLGGIALRYGENDLLGRLGNIGYGVRPSERGRGIATWALSEMAIVAQTVGLARLLLVCDADNPASVKTIEANGGVGEHNAGASPAGALRYWIEIGNASSPPAETVN